MANRSPNAAWRWLEASRQGTGWAKDEWDWTKGCRFSASMFVPVPKTEGSENGWPFSESARRGFGVDRIHGMAPRQGGKRQAKRQAP